MTVVREESYDRWETQATRCGRHLPESNAEVKLNLLHQELTVVLNSYLLAGIPIGFLAVAGWMSPLYRQPWSRLARWWSWMALVFAASAIVVVGIFG